MDPVDQVPDAAQPAAGLPNVVDHELNLESKNLVANLRLRRIEDLQASALADPDALEANLEATTSGLLRIGYRLEQVIEKALEKRPNSLEQFERLQPAIDTFLRITRQVDRFAQFKQRIASARQAGGPGKSR